MSKLRRTEEQSVDYHTEGEHLQSYVGYKRKQRPVTNTHAVADSLKAALVDYWEVELQELRRFPEWGKLVEAKAAALARIKAKWRV